MKICPFCCFVHELKKNMRNSYDTYIEFGISNNQLFLIRFKKKYSQYLVSIRRNIPYNVADVTI